MWSRLRGCWAPSAAILVPIVSGHALQDQQRPWRPTERMFKRKLSRLDAHVPATTTWKLLATAPDPTQDRRTAGWSGSLLEKIRARNPLLLLDASARQLLEKEEDAMDESDDALDDRDLEGDAIEVARRTLDFIIVRPRHSPHHYNHYATRFTMLHDIPLPKILQLESVQTAGTAHADRNWFTPDAVDCGAWCFGTLTPDLGDMELLCLGAAAFLRRQIYARRPSITLPDA
jgi:hypothetical protein